MNKAVRQRIWKTLLVMIVFVVIFYVTFKINNRYIRENTEMVRVAVAIREIPAYTQIKEEDLILAKRPLSVIPKDAVYDTKELLESGTYYTGEFGLEAGDILRVERLFLSDQNPLGSLARLRDENKMLIAVNTNLVQSTANLVIPGAVVDAVVFIAGDNETPDQVISPLEDPRLGDLLVVDKKNSEAAIPAEKGRDAIPAVITIMLEREELDIAEALVSYNELGSIYLLPVGFEGDIYLAAQAKVETEQEKI
ncbi:MAG: SAF domain-containing protein [Peptococcia bacterium]